MTTRAPMSPCTLCGIVPHPPSYNADTDEYVVSCPCCGRGAAGASEDLARENWAAAMNKPEPDKDGMLKLLDSIEAAMCDLEGLRQIPGAMTVWHRWEDAYKDLRKCIMEARRESP